VATAVGLVVAIPAVAMYNLYQRISRSILANTDALSHVLLSIPGGRGSGHRALSVAEAAEGARQRARVQPTEPVHR